MKWIPNIFMLFLMIFMITSCQKYDVIEPDSDIQKFGVKSVIVEDGFDDDDDDDPCEGIERIDGDDVITDDEDEDDDDDDGAARNKN